MMKSLGWFFFGIILAILLVVASNAWSSETIQACTKTDGTVTYTNKNVKGCATVKLPELSTVPSQHAQLSSVIPTDPEPAIVPKNTINDSLCALYDEWMTLSQKTLGGFANNAVPDTQRRLVLVQLFGAGVMPMNCTNAK